MITASGQTFQHRETLKGMRGRWNPAGNNWQFDYLTPGQIATLRGLVGVMVSEDVAEPPQPRPQRPKPPSGLLDIDALISELTERDKRGETDSRYKTAIYGDNQQYFNHFKDKNPAAFFGFSSLAAHVAYIDRLPADKRRGHGWIGDVGGWNGAEDMDAALRIARDGWQAGIEQADEILQILNIEHATQRKRSYSVAGGQVNIGKLLSGNPMHMIKRPKQPGRKIVTLFVETSMSAGIRAETMKIRAVIIAALAEILEREGYSCEIVTTDISLYGSRGRAIYQLATTLKAAGERLNLFDVIFGLGHSAFLRRLSFASLSSSDEIWAIAGESQGGPSVMFNDEYPTARNEFYIRPLTTNVEGDTLHETVIAMLPLIEPANLPVKIINAN